MGYRHSNRVLVRGAAANLALIQLDLDGPAISLGFIGSGFRGYRYRPTFLRVRDICKGGPMSVSCPTRPSDPDFFSKLAMKYRMRGACVVQVGKISLVTVRGVQR